MTYIPSGPSAPVEWVDVQSKPTNVVNLTTELSGKAPSSHAHASADLTSGTIATGRLGTGSASSLTFLRGDQTWGTPVGVGDALVALTLDQFADVTQAATKTLAITESTTLAGGTQSGTNTGDATLAGTLDYITISGQQITRGAVDLATDVTGDLPFANVAQVVTDRLLGRDTAGTGDLEALTVGGGVEFTGAGGIQTSALTGDVTKTAGGTALTIANDAVSYAKMQNVSATSRLLGRITAGAGDAEELTGTQATTLLDAVTSVAKGLAPASGGGTANFLRADGTWTAPPTGGAWTTLKQTADDSKADNVLAASTFLTLALSAATAYTIRGTAFLLVQNSGADARFDLNYSGTWTTVYCIDSRNVAGVAAGTDATTVRITSGLPTSTDLLSTSTGVCVVEFEISGLTNASGTLVFRFAQVTNNASATLLKRGSYLEYMTA